MAKNYSKTNIMSFKANAVNPIYVLANEDDDFIHKEEVTSRIVPVKASKCMCAACDNMFDVDLSLEVKNVMAPTTKPAVVLFRDYNDSKIDIKCPDCGNEGVYQILLKNGQNDKGSGRIPGAWSVPPVMEGRYLFQNTDENGKVVSIEDNLLGKAKVIYPSGKVFKYMVELSETTDLEKHTVKTTRTEVVGDKRKVLTDALGNKATSPLDVFSPDKSTFCSSPIRRNINSELKLGIVYSGRNYIRCTTIDTPTIVKYIPGSMTYYNDKDKFSIDPIDAKDWNKQAELLELQKAKLLEKQFSFSKDGSFTGDTRLFLSEFHPGSTEENTPLNQTKIAAAISLMSRYPMAFEYAERLAEADFENKKYSAMRKKQDKYIDAKCEELGREASEEEKKAFAQEAKENITLDDIDLPMSVKGKLFRERFDEISNQLMNVDEKILKTIQKAKTFDEFKSSMQFFAFGENEVSKLNGAGQKPSTIRTNDIKGEAYDASKNFVAKFNENMIGLANTMYTARKFGFQDPNILKQIVDMTYDESVVPEIACNKTLQPINSKDAVRFARALQKANESIVKSKKGESIIRDETKVMNLIFGEANTRTNRITSPVRAFYESAPMYAKVKDKGYVIESNEEFEKNRREYEADNLKSYLKNHSVEEAYVDYIDQYGDNTKETIDCMIKSLIDRHNSGDDGYKGVPVWPTDKKPLLRNRTSMRDIHDQLSNMSRKIPQADVPIQYNANENSLEHEYVDEKTGRKFAFKLHTTTYDMVRTSSVLDNCLSSHTSQAISKQHTYLYMEDADTHERINCISLRRNYGSSSKIFSVVEFQGANDHAVYPEYVDVCMKWLNENNIEYAGNRDVACFGADRFIYGGNGGVHMGNTIDDTTNRVMSNFEMQKVQAKREEKAAKLYGRNPDGTINVPKYDGPDINFL